MQEPTLPAPERPSASDAAGAAEPRQTAASDPDLAADPRVMQILSTEHWGLLSARSLAYNEAFTRAGMFLSFLSMSFVALALLAQAIGFSTDFLMVAALVVAFDLLIGFLTFVRQLGTAREDMRATQGMNRIRQAYVRLSPGVQPYLSAGVTDDAEGVFQTYFIDPAGGVAADIAYGFSTSHAMVALVVSVLVGLEAAIIALLWGATAWLAAGAGIVVSLLSIAALATWTYRSAMAYSSSLEVRFPTPQPEPPAGA